MSKSSKSSPINSSFYTPPQKIELKGRKRTTMTSGSENNDPGEGGGGEGGLGEGILTPLIADEV